MQYTKDNQIFSAYEVRNAHPSTSFAPSTYAELGYVEYTPPVTPEASAIYTPAVVSARQMRLALSKLGLLALVSASVNTSVAEDSEEMRISWEYATEFHRSNILVLSMQAALGKTDVEVDAIFTLAATL